jgi:hypothetical protein
MRKAVGVFVGAIAIAAGAVVMRPVPVDAQSASEQDKVTAQRFHLDMIAKKQVDIADQIFTPDAVIHTAGGPGRTKGPERAKAMANGDFRQYPKGIQITHNVVFGEKDLVGFQWTFVGTTESGETETLEGIDIARMKDGKIAELWLEYHTVKK